MWFLTSFWRRKCPNNDPRMTPNSYQMAPLAAQGAPGGGGGGDGPPQRPPMPIWVSFSRQNLFQNNKNTRQMTSKSLIKNSKNNLNLIHIHRNNPLESPGVILVGFREHLRICAPKHPESQATCRTMLFAMPPLAVVIVVVCGLSVCTIVSTQCYKVLQETSLFPRS